MRFFDLHCDTLYEMVTKNTEIYKNNLHVSVEKSEKYDPYIGCFAVWIPDNLRNEEAFNFFKKCHSTLVSQEKLYKNKFKICKSSQDLNLALDSGKSGIILTVEGSSAIGGNLSNVEYLSRCGVKMMTMTWNGLCEAGSGAECEKNIGLTNFGKKIVHLMNKYGIIADVSHAGEKLFYDVLEISKKPVVASHSNSRKICNHRRNISDSQFKCIKETGGLVGITFCKKFLNSSDNKGIEDIFSHVEHFLSLGGENTLAFGSDFDGAEMPGGINGLESIENIYEYFLVKNYKEDLLDKIFFSNAYRFMNSFFQKGE